MDDQVLIHEYDPAKRREYYLKNRLLKGRKHGTAQPKPKAKTKAQLQKERQKKLEDSVGKLKGRLEDLQSVLELLVKQAKARSGVKATASSKKVEQVKSDSKSTSTSKTSSASSKKGDRKPLTASQKAAEAKAQKKYRSKNEQLSAEVKSLHAKIKAIQERIAKMQKSGSLGARQTTKQ